MTAIINDLQDIDSCCVVLCARSAALTSSFCPLLYVGYCGQMRHIPCHQKTRGNRGSLGCVTSQPAACKTLEQTAKSYSTSTTLSVPYFPMLLCPSTPSTTWYYPVDLARTCIVLARCVGRWLRLWTPNGVWRGTVKGYDAISRPLRFPTPACRVLLSARPGKPLPKCSIAGSSDPWGAVLEVLSTLSIPSIAALAGSSHTVLPESLQYQL